MQVLAIHCYLFSVYGVNSLTLTLYDELWLHVGPSSTLILITFGSLNDFIGNINKAMFKESQLMPYSPLGAHPALRLHRVVHATAWVEEGRVLQSLRECMILLLGRGNKVAF